MILAPFAVTDLFIMVRAYLFQHTRPVFKEYTELKFCDNQNRQEKPGFSESEIDGILSALL